MSYLEKAINDARDTVSNFEDEILEQLLDGEVSDDLLNDYDGGDAWHHENHIDHAYNLQEACAIITELSEYEESDSGLWDGLPMKEAVGACAAYTYGNAVYDQWRELIGEINDEGADIINDYDEQIEEANKTDAETLEDEKQDALRALIQKIAD